MSDVEAKGPKPCEWCKGEKVRRILHRGTGELHRVSCACTHELPVRFVYQPENSGCCIAAVAMIVGKSYFDVKQLMNVEHDLSCEGIHYHEWQDLLVDLGFASQFRSSWSPRLKDNRAVWPCAPWADLHFCEVINTRASGQHSVVLLRDGRVLDPWWGVLQGLHRYPRVVSMTAVYRVPEKAPEGAAA